MFIANHGHAAAGRARPPRAFALPAGPAGRPEVPAPRPQRTRELRGGFWKRGAAPAAAPGARGQGRLLLPPRRPLATRDGGRRRRGRPSAPPCAPGPAPPPPGSWSPAPRPPPSGSGSSPGRTRPGAPPVRPAPRGGNVENGSQPEAGPRQGRRPDAPSRACSRLPPPRRGHPGTGAAGDTGEVPPGQRGASRVASRLASAQPRQGGRGGALARGGARDGLPACRAARLPPVAGAGGGGGRKWAKPAPRSAARTSGARSPAPVFL